MKIAFLTTDDPIYLPAFFDRVLARYGNQTVGVYVVPPVLKKQVPMDAAKRYWKTFGLGAAAHLSARVLSAKIRNQSITTVCAMRKVPCSLASDVNAQEFLAKLRAQGPDVLVSVSCPQLFKKPLIDLAPRGILNIHGAILPQYRGVMPSFWMLANGEKVAGVSIYFVNEKIDAGDLCAQRTFEVLPAESLDDFVRRSKTIAADLLMEVFEQMEQGKIARQPLDLSRGSYNSWPDAQAVQRFRASGRQLW